VGSSASQRDVGGRTGTWNAVETAV
jgi:hypothetical protein